MATFCDSYPQLAPVPVTVSVVHEIDGVNAAKGWRALRFRVDEACGCKGSFCTIMKRGVAELRVNGATTQKPGRLDLYNKADDVVIAQGALREVCEPPRREPQD